MTRLALALGTTRWSLESRRAGLISSSSTGPAANICGAPAGKRVGRDGGNTGDNPDGLDGDNTGQALPRHHRAVRQECRRFRHHLSRGAS
jgi:hypothetical protein